MISSDSASFELSVKNTFSIYKMKHIVVATYRGSREQNLLGFVRFSLHKLLTCHERIENKLPDGSVIGILARPTDTKMKNLRFRFSGRGLGENKIGVNSGLHAFMPNPFLVLCYQRSDDSSSSKKPPKNAESSEKGKNRWEVLWKSNVVHGSKDPIFDYGQLPTAKLSADTPLCITALNYDDKTKQHTLIGQSKMTYHQLLASAGFALRHNKMTAGYIGIEHMDMTLVPSFSHYLSQGELELDLMVAVDFTRNNMIDDSDYNDHRSFLHHLRRNGKMNGYQIALTTIGRVFEELESTEKINHIWGFGANDLNGNVKNRLRMGKDKGRVRGASGLLNAYNETAAGNISMGDHKDLRSTLYTAIARAEMNSSSAKLNYSVLLVLCCEGMVHELNETLEEICEASYTPLSIIFVGVGRGNFADFQDIANDQTMSPSGKEFMRDCVGFVHLDEYQQDANKLLKAALRDVSSFYSCLHACRLWSRSFYDRTHIDLIDSSFLILFHFPLSLSLSLYPAQPFDAATDTKTDCPISHVKGNQCRWKNWDECQSPTTGRRSASGRCRSVPFQPPTSSSVGVRGERRHDRSICLCFAGFFYGCQRSEQRRQRNTNGTFRGRTDEVGGQEGLIEIELGGGRIAHTCIIYIFIQSQSDCNNAQRGERTVRACRCYLCLYLIVDTVPATVSYDINSIKKKCIKTISFMHVRTRTSQDPLLFSPPTSPSTPSLQATRSI